MPDHPPHAPKHGPRKQLLEISVGEGEIALAGELDLSQVDALRDELGPLLAPGRVLVVDLSELSFMDSSGLHVILDAARTVGDSGRVVLRNPNDPIRRLLRISGVQGHVPNLEVDPPERID